MEMYSPPRVTAQASKFGLRAGEAMDLVTGYNFDLEEDRQKAMEILERDQPALVIGSPECKMFSGLQNLTKWTGRKQEKLEKAKRHLEFICKVYRKQIDQGRWFLHEHPCTATSWSEKCVLDIMRMDTISTTITDQCMFGLRTWGVDGRPMPAKKKTRFMSNANEILSAINKNVMARMCTSNC